MPFLVYASPPAGSQVRKSLTFWRESVPYELRRVLLVTGKAGQDRKAAVVMCAAHGDGVWVERTAVQGYKDYCFRAPSRCTVLNSQRPIRDSVLI